MSPISAGRLLKENLGREIVVHYTCRDRNILGIQADLLGASAMGMDNFLALGGDPPSIGDYPFATGVYDLSSEGLVEMMSSLNHGLDLLGNPIGKPSRFFIGVGMGIGRDPKKDMESARKKLRKGAHFVITQPVFAPEACAITFAALRKSGVLVVAGVLPLVSFRNAEYLHYEVPGIFVPENHLKRMENKKGRDAEKEGVEIAREIIEDLKPLCDGILLMPPLGRYRLIEDLLA
jgi:homocysteine S-methyltransferase